MAANNGSHPYRRCTNKGTPKKANAAPVWAEGNEWYWLLKSRNSCPRHKPFHSSAASVLLGRDRPARRRTELTSPGNRCGDHHAEQDLANDPASREPGETETQAPEKHQFRPISPIAEKPAILERFPIVCFHPLNDGLIKSESSVRIRRFQLSTDRRDERPQTSLDFSPLWLLW